MHTQQTDPHILDIVHTNHTYEQHQPHTRTTTAPQTDPHILNIIPTNHTNNNTNHNNNNNYTHEPQPQLRFSGRELEALKAAAMQPLSKLGPDVW